MGWPRPSVHLKLRMKVAESPHRTSIHPKKDLDHNSEGMTENYPENVATGHPRMDGTNP